MLAFVDASTLASCRVTMGESELTSRHQVGALARTVKAVPRQADGRFEQFCPRKTAVLVVDGFEAAELSRDAHGETTNSRCGF